jgi:hypothetical protein
MSQTLTTGEFYRQIKQLNPRLRICSFDGNDKLAGLYILGHAGEEYFDICGVDKGYVPEYTEWDAAGHIVKSGWRRVYLMLIQLGFTSAAKVRKVCPGFFLHWSQAMVDEDRKVQIVGDPIAKKLNRYADKEKLSSDDVLELATDIRAKDTDHVKAEQEKDRWFLETWRKRGGNQSDKPNY